MNTHVFDSVTDEITWLADNWDRETPIVVPNGFMQSLLQNKLNLQNKYLTRREDLFKRFLEDRNIHYLLAFLYENYAKNKALIVSLSGEFLRGIVPKNFQEWKGIDELQLREIFGMPLLDDVPGDDHQTKIILQDDIEFCFDQNVILAGCNVTLWKNFAQWCARFNVVIATRHKRDEKGKKLFGAGNH